MISNHDIAERLAEFDRSLERLDERVRDLDALEAQVRTLHDSVQELLQRTAPKPDDGGFSAAMSHLHKAAKLLEPVTLKLGSSLPTLRNELPRPRREDDPLQLREFSSLPPDFLTCPIKMEIDEPLQYATLHTPTLPSTPTTPPQ